MNSVCFVLATVLASAWGSITPVVVQQEAQQSVVAPVTAAIPVTDLYVSPVVKDDDKNHQGRPAYRSIYAAAPMIEDQKSAASEAAAAGLVQTDAGLLRAVNYAVPVGYQAQVVHPVALGPRLLGPGISISPAARGFALGGLTGLGLGLGARSLMAGVPLGLGVHSALSTPALGLGLGASAAALLG